MNDLQIRALAEQWGSAFESAIATKDAAKLAGLLSDPAYFRDNGALTWDYRQFHGRDTVVSILLSLAAEIKPHGFAVSTNWPAPHLFEVRGSSMIEVFFDFETKHGSCVALVNAVVDDNEPAGMRMSAIFTRLEELKAIDQPPRHPRGRGYAPSFPGETWLQNRSAKKLYLDTEPEVVVVGAGQAGLVTAAYLKSFGVSVLNVDKYDAVGDSWGKRYDSLFLHNPVEMNGFPFLPFPSHYLEYLPKDVISEWLNLYARYLDLDVWSATEFHNAEYDEQQERWNVKFRLADGSERTLHPRHIVLATGGIGGKPLRPQLPGLASFRGTVIHSSEYTKRSDYHLQRAIIVGVATSAHDIARDLHDAGVEVTMLQRGPVVVTNIDTANLAYAAYLDPEIPTALVDIR